MIDLHNYVKKIRDILYDDSNIEIKASNLFELDFEFCQKILNYVDHP
ncbi:hypothetical protein LCGC14_2185570 [marine sediment metagenome]|uniref:Uncharacterized protein n=1 Tax=marine sediment metagenome TaxID=412755 RepID=A0A0F9E844_9ZZZZ